MNILNDETSLATRKDNFIELIKNEIKKYLTSDNIKFGAIRSFIDEASEEERIFHILCVCMVLYAKGENTPKEWSQWREKFLKEYLHEIIAYCFGKADPSLFAMIPHNSSLTIIDVFSELIKNGTVTGCSYDRLARMMKIVFNISYSERTISSMLRN